MTKVSLARVCVRGGFGGVLLQRAFGNLQGGKGHLELVFQGLDSKSALLCFAKHRKIPFLFFFWYGSLYFSNILPHLVTKRGSLEV